MPTVPWPENTVTQTLPRGPAKDLAQDDRVANRLRGEQHLLNLDSRQIVSCLSALMPCFDAALLQPAKLMIEYVVQVGLELVVSLIDLFAQVPRVLGNLLRAAHEAGVTRVVVTGSLSAVGNDPNRPSDETVPFYPFETLPPYSHTKAGVEHECLKAAVEGLDVVIATSCAIIGPNDFKPSRMGKTLIDFASGKLRAYIPGGFTFVSAKDMVQGHMLAMEKGRSGQKYIFASEFLSVDQLMTIFEGVTGRQRPRLRLHPQLMAGIAQVSSFVQENFFPDAPQRFTPAAVKFLRMQRKADNSKAQRELGFRPTTIAEAVREAYECFVRRGVIVKRAGS